MSTDHKDSSKKKFDPLQWVSQVEAASLRGVTRQAISSLVKKGRFTTLFIGGKTLLKRSEVEDFMPKSPGPSPKKKSKETSAKR
jgi:excisionase family DNA binding protein